MKKRVPKRLSASDRKSLKRLLARYEGARWSPGRSWIPAAVQSARFDAAASTRLELVRKSRYFEKNNAIQNRMADLFECYTVGAGLQVNPASDDAKWNAAAKLAWDDWAPFCDLVSRQHFSTLMGLVARTWFVDGEVFILLTRGDSGRPRIQLIEGHLVETPPDMAALEGASVYDGIQVDGNGRPIGYWVASEAKDGKRAYSLKDAQNIVHVFEPSRPGQYRGLPFCYPVINDLHDLDDLQILENKAARDAAEKTNVLKNAAGEFDDETLLREAENISNQDLNGESVTEDRARYVQESIGGRSIALRVGEEFTQFKTERPTDQTTAYWRLLSEKICVGQGMPYVIAFPDSMQGTVYRGALDMANSFFRARFQVIKSAGERIYEYVIDSERLRNPVLRDLPGNWRKVSVNPPRAVNVDVGRNSTAMIAELGAGVRTFAGVCGETGEDWREVLTQKAREAAFVQQLAEQFDVDASAISTIAQPEPNAASPDGESQSIPISQQE